MGIYAPAADAPDDGFGAGHPAGTVCPPAELTVSACPSGNALECRYYALGSGSSQARLFVAMLIAAGLPMLCCMPALLCHAMSWIAGDSGDDGDAAANGQEARQYQAIPRPGLTAADLEAHTLPIVNDGSLPRQFGHQHCSVCHEDFEDGEELRQLKCSHFFHSQCIDRWLAGHDTCPLCNSSAVVAWRPQVVTAEPEPEPAGGDAEVSEEEETALLPESDREPSPRTPSPRDSLSSGGSSRTPSPLNGSVEEEAEGGGGAAQAPPRLDEEQGGPSRESVSMTEENPLLPRP